MSSATLYTKTGAKSEQKVTLPKDIFEVEVKNYDLLKQAYLRHLSNGRTARATTKTRAEVRGGGRKPWRQKGTGRARVGSIRSPIWRGGGITFGPTGEQNFVKQLPTKAKRAALRQALSLASQDGKIIALETFETNGKVKETVALLAKLGAADNTLILVSERDDLVDRATRNLPAVKAAQVQKLTVYHVLNADHLIISSQSLEILKDWLGNK